MHGSSLRSARYDGLFWLFAVLLLSLSAAPAAAQETQVPFDSAGRVLTVDAAAMRRLAVPLDTAADFREARLFQSVDGGYVLEITRERDGRLVRERRPLGAAEVADLRRRVSTAVAQRAPELGLNQEGRSLLIGQAALAGLTFYGAAVPVITEANGSSAAGLYLLTAGASVLVPYVLTQRAPVSYAMANLSRYGITRGILHGALLYQAVAGPEEEFTAVPDECSVDGPCYADDESGTSGRDRAQTATALLTSVGEGVAGYLWARNERMTPGTASAIGLGGDFGMFGGLALSRIAGADPEGRGLAVATLAGGALGMAGMRGVAARRDYTWGDANVMYTSGLVGAFTGLAVAALADADDKPAFAAALLGSSAGLILGDRYVRGADFTVGQASLTQLGTLAGAAVGAGIGVLVGGDEGDENLVIASTAVGALAGFGLTYRSLAGAARERRGEALGLGGGWKLRVSPVGVAALARGTGGGAARTVPLVSFERRM